MTPEHRSALQERLARNPGIILETLAEAGEATLAELIECLPAGCWHKMAGERMTDVLQQVAGWGEVTTIIHTADGIFEIGGAFPAGESGHGFYNLKNTGGLHGHLRPERCAAVYAVERPFMNKATASLLFANHAGGIMFKIFVGRDAEGQLRADQLAALRALPARMAAATEPPCTTC